MTISVDAWLRGRMIHASRLVADIWERMQALLQLVSSLEAQIKNGALPQLGLARHQIGDVENFFLASLEREAKTPPEETKKSSELSE